MNGVRSSGRARSPLRSVPVERLVTLANTVDDTREDGAFYILSN